MTCKIYCDLHVIYVLWYDLIDKNEKHNKMILWK